MFLSLIGLNWVFILGNQFVRTVDVNKPFQISLSKVDTGTSDSYEIVDIKWKEILKGQFSQK